MRHDAPAIIATSPALAAAAWFFPPWIAAPSPAAATAANGALLDTSAWDAWSLRILCSGAPAPVSVQFVWFEDVTEPALWDGLQEPVLSVPGGTGEYRIVGRVRSPLCALMISAAAPIAVGAVRATLQFSNRTRCYDSPYTPELLGSLLASIPLNSIAPAASVTRALPFFIGPAHVNAFMDPTGGGRTEIVGSGGDELITMNDTTEHQAGLWVPSLANGTGVWTLKVTNRSAGNSNLGASVTAQ